MSLTRILDYELLGFVYLLAAFVGFQILTNQQLSDSLTSLIAGDAAPTEPPAK
jgi:hypothetical protein